MSETAAVFDWRDPLLLEAQLGEEERLFSRAVQAFAQDRLMPLILGRAQTGIQAFSA